MPQSPPHPRRIALCIHSLYGGGAERLMSQLAGRWHQQGHEVHLVTWATVATDRYEVPSAVRRHGLGLLKASRNPVAGVWANLHRVRALRSTLQTIQPELVLSFCDQMNIVTLEAARRLSCPVVVSEHSDPAKQQLAGFWEWWRSRNYPTAKACIALTDAIAAYMQRWTTCERIRVIPPAISPPEPHLGAEKPKHILAVGRLSREKGFDLLLEAWRSLAAQLPQWRLQIAGSGPLEAELKRYAEDLPRVDFLGWLNDPWSAYDQASLFVLCSRYEGFPVALVEALSQGVPAIATACTQATQKLASTSSLQLVAPESAEALAVAIGQLANAPDRREELSEAGLRASRDYHWSQVGPLWDQLVIDYASGDSRKR